MNNDSFKVFVVTLLENMALWNHDIVSHVSSPLELAVILKMNKILQQRHLQNLYKLVKLIALN